MAVLYYSIAVFISVFASFWIAKYIRSHIQKKMPKFAHHSKLITPKSLSLAVLGFWIIWTLSLVETLPLKIVQIGVGVVAYLIGSKYLKKDREIENRDTRIIELEAQCSTFERELTELAELNKKIRLDRSNVSELYTHQDHSKALKKGLESCNEQLIIVSGWATDYVINDKFEKLILAALKRGVSVFLSFGYEKKNFPKFDSEIQKRAVKRINKIAQVNEQQKNAGTLSVILVPTHRKLLIVDDTKAICGSFNWLSNGGGFNDEMSLVVSNKNDVYRISNYILDSFSKLPPTRRQFLKKLFPFGAY